MMSEYKIGRTAFYSIFRDFEPKLAVLAPPDAKSNDLLNEGFHYYSIVNDDMMSSSIQSNFRKYMLLSQSLDELIVTSMFLHLVATWSLYPDSCYSDQSCF